MKRVLSISFALIILTASSGIAFITHFCGGEAVMDSFSLGFADLDCGMSDESSCHIVFYDNDIIQTKKCCENQIQLLQINQILLTNFVQAEPITFTSILASLINNNTEVSLNVSRNYADFHPPPLTKHKLQILLQTFLI